MEEKQTAVEELLGFALENGLIEKQDLPFCRNLLLDALGIGQPMKGYRPTEALACEEKTATRLLLVLTQGEQTPQEQELLFARLMGLLTARPSEITRRFFEFERQSPQSATDWFYSLCRANDYIRVDRIAQNLLFTEPSKYGDLIITINLSKPEKDPREIERQAKAQSVHYPPCMLCVENPGYAGRPGFPARQNHRAIPLALGGESWYFQYSPYLYYDEHCIVFCEEHRPMKVEKNSFIRLFDFVDRFPHYFLGSNAGLPIVGGSILGHDHFQGGRYEFPMMKAPILVPLKSPSPGIRAGIVDWPMSCLRLWSKDRRALIDLADETLRFWQDYSDESLQILAKTDSPHNAVTPIVRKNGDVYTLDLVLRNNRTSPALPMGLFHPHPDLHHIKMENIGLIEVMGLFVLPGRLKEELSAVEELLCSKERPQADEGSPVSKHLPWLLELKEKYPRAAREDAAAIIRKELARKCERILEDAGVFKQDESGVSGFLRFLRSAGFEPIPY